MQQLKIGGIIIFTNKDRKLLREPYFIFLREEERFIEVKSKNTQHCWMIFKKVSPSDRPVTLYHKHHQSDPYYHKQYATLTVKHAIQILKEHDEYILTHQQRQSACKS